ncbi:MAG: sigma-70 family RNA polymerase sigma factor [Bryobacteraceae bacterium]
MESQRTAGGVCLKDPDRSADPDRLAAAAGDFEAMLRVYRPKVFRFALASLRDDDAAASVTQDCFLRAFRARPTFRGESSLDTWLMRIAVNLVRDYVRNRRLQFWKRTSANSEEMGAADLRTAAAGRTPESQMLLREQVSSVWRAAGKLPDRQRTVFLLRFVEDMELLEIASATGMKEGTVKAHLFSAVRNVRRQMGVTV